MLLVRPPLVLLHALALLLLACSQGSNLAPFSSFQDAGPNGESPDGGAKDAEAGLADGGNDPTLGKPCVNDEDCGDDVPCTLDRCDPEAGRCRNIPDDKVCADDSACNGSEVCDPKLGCRPGPPITCSDGEVCTIDKCIEDELGISCQHVLRDADGDGDVDANCKGGDCDDTHPRISSKAAEICGNNVDDNCDGQVDEEGCIQPAHDRCDDPLLLPGPGLYSISLAGAKLDTSSTCAPVSLPSLREVVAGLIVPEGPPRQVDVRVTWPSGINAFSLGKQCGVAEEELACAVSVPNSTAGGQVAKLRVHSLAPGVYPLLVYSSQDTTASISYQLGPASSPPANETCSTAALLLPDTPTVAPIVGTSPNVPSQCGSPTFPDLVYRMELDHPYDVRVFASPADGVGTAVASIRNAACSLLTDEITCATGSLASAFARKLGPGPIYVSVASSAGSDLNLLVTLSPPTDPLPEESCSPSPPLLAPNKDRALDLTDHTDDHTLCSIGQPDAAFSLPLQEPSDLLLVLRTSNSTSGTLSLAHPACTSSDLLSCKSALPSPLRLPLRNVTPGDYRVIVDLSSPTPAQLTPLVRKSLPPLFVPFADTCEDAQLIPLEGGSFQGNTANVNAQYAAGCDQGNAPNAPDQMLRLDLPQKKRVVFDMNGSAYPTLLNIRKGPGCPGKEVSLGCTIGTLPQRSFLDLTLDEGTYFVQIDGFNGASGAWFLDVFVSDPLPQLTGGIRQPERLPPLALPPTPVDPLAHG
ncbi:MAG: putative metal-binding motif-containing protein [Myxococcales bacterium]|nr:putative metal-binding motif-containing protein [Polyangiaceae bacterium]MDW8249543.1 putative metal-binding motif-containing protein [Myxococcales bacterium]